MRDDLVNIPETIKIEHWVNVYRREDGSICIGDGLFLSNDDAMNVGKTAKNYIGTARFRNTLTT